MKGIYDAWLKKPIEDSDFTKISLTCSVKGLASLKSG